MLFLANYQAVTEVAIVWQVWRDICDALSTTCEPSSRSSGRT